MIRSFAMIALVFSCCGLFNSDTRCLKNKKCTKVKREKIKEIQSGKTYICCRYKDLGCDIAYEITPKTHHKVIRKLNAHESQRCPCNKNRTRKARGKTRALRNCSAIHIAKALAAKPPAARVELRKKRKLKKASKEKRPKVVAADSRASSGTTLVVEDRAERAAAQSAPARPSTELWMKQFLMHQIFQG